MSLYPLILDAIFRWCWDHVPGFPDRCVDAVNEVERKIHGAILRPDVISQAREILSQQQQGSSLLQYPAKSRTIENPVTLLLDDKAGFSDLITYQLGYNL